VDYYSPGSLLRRGKRHRSTCSLFPTDQCSRTLLPKASGKRLSHESNYLFFLKNFYSWRQKQYFEQKKRQRQQQNFGSDNDVEGTNVDCQQQKENRSLDILSLLNLSTAPQEYKSSCPNSEHLKFVSTEGCQDLSTYIPV